MYFAAKVLLFVIIFYSSSFFFIRMHYVRLFELLCNPKYVFYMNLIIDIGNTVAKIVVLRQKKSLKYFMPQTILLMC